MLLLSMKMLSLSKAFITLVIDIIKAKLFGKK